MTPRLLKPQEVAQRLGCTVKTLLGHVQDGSLRYVNVGRGEIQPRYMFAESDLAEFEEARRRRNGGQCHVGLPAKRQSVLPIRLPLARSSLSRLYETNKQARSRKGGASRARAGEEAHCSGYNRKGITPT